MSRRNLEAVADDLEQLSPAGAFEQLQPDDFDDEDGPVEKKMAFGG